MPSNIHAAVSEPLLRLTNQQSRATSCFLSETTAQDSTRNTPISFSEYFKGFTTTRSLKALAWDLPQCSVSSESTEDASGPNPKPTRERRFTSPWVKPRP